MSVDGGGNGGLKAYVLNQHRIQHFLAWRNIWVKFTNYAGRVV